MPCPAAPAASPSAWRRAARQAVHSAAQQLAGRLARHFGAEHRDQLVVHMLTECTNRQRRRTEVALDTGRGRQRLLGPEAGVRLDFTFNWQKPTEIASRIQSIMPPDTAGAFSAFGWDAVNVVVQGLVELEERPNLIKLTKYIEGGIEPVLEASLRSSRAGSLAPKCRWLRSTTARSPSG